MLPAALNESEKEAVNESQTIADDLIDDSYNKRLISVYSFFINFIQGVHNSNIISNNTKA